MDVLYATPAEKAEALGYSKSKYNSARGGRLAKNNYAAVIAKAKEILGDTPDETIAPDENAETSHAASDVTPEGDASQNEFSDSTPPDEFVMPAFDTATPEKEISHIDSKPNGSQKKSSAPQKTEPITPVRAIDTGVPIATVALTSIGGGVSPTGIDLCLTSKSYIELSQNPTEQTVRFICDQIRNTRGLINMLTMTGGLGDVSHEVRVRFEAESVELELAMRRNARKYPGLQNELYDDLALDDDTRAAFAEVLATQTPSDDSQ